MALFVFHKETKPIKYTMTIIRLIVVEAYKNFNAMDFYKKYVYPLHTTYFKYHEDLQG